MAANPSPKTTRDLRPAALAVAAFCVLTLALVLHVLPAMRPLVITLARPTPDLFVEICSALTGVLGTWLLARKGERAGWGFVAYLASNAGWIVFAWQNQHWAMLLQQLVFTVVSLYGIWTWLVLPWIDRRVDDLLEGAPW